MLRKTLLLLLRAALLLVCVDTLGSKSAQAGTPESTEQSRDTVLRYLRRVGTSSDIAIRLYYQAVCGSNDEDPVPFPVIAVQPPSNGSTGLRAVREIFKKDRNVTVTEDAGVIRIYIGEVPTEILRTNLSLLSFDEIAQYNPNQAIMVINNTKEMEAAMRSLGFSPVWSASSSRALPAEELPHLPTSIKDVTVEQVLDLIAKTWDGPVIYGACATSKDASVATKFLIDSAQDVIPKGRLKRMSKERR